MAGWFTENAARNRVTIRRDHPTTGEPIRIPPIDVDKILSENRTELDLILEPGDIISVDSRRSESVYIFGHVEAPGEYPYSPGLTLGRLVSLGEWSWEMPRRAGSGLALAIETESSPKRLLATLPMCLPRSNWSTR